LTVPAKFVRGAFPDHDESVRSAVWLIRHLSAHAGLEDLGDTDVLDFGCGVKLTEGLLNYSLPIGRYVGFDVYRDMISFLKAHVADDRFEYFHVDIHNALYNPGGEPLWPGVALPIDGRTFDLIVLLSVFTHLAPSDYRNMLLLLRRYAKRDTRLIYSLYIDQLTQGGHGLMDAWSRALDQLHGELADVVRDHVDATTGGRRVEPFKDLDTSRPLRWAVYSESYARELAEATGWKVLSLSPPDVYIQHHFVCTPC
jgi:SAM-dependent methyltransferase